MAESSASGRHDGREEEDKYLCLEGEVGREDVPVRQKDENWEPQMKGERELEVTELISEVKR